MVIQDSNEPLLKATEQPGVYSYYDPPDDPRLRRNMRDFGLVCTQAYVSDLEDETIRSKNR
jgi:hypothetical protein